jgi:hypothetical protein
MYPGGESKDHWPTLGLNTLRWAKKQGAICGPAHSGNGLTEYAGRVEGGREGAHRLPNFNLPAYNGIGANEYVMDITHDVPGPGGKLVKAVDFISAMDTDRVAEWNMWYHSLNAGFQVKVSGETDFPCIYGQRVGIGRVYCKQPGLPRYDAWCQAIADGQSYVSDGTTHLLDFQTTAPKKIEMGVLGSELKLEKPGEVTFSVQAAARLPKLLRRSIPVELIVNGQAVASKEVATEGTRQALEFPIKLEKSSWVAVRVFPHAHTNPIFVIVDGKPIREQASIAWCLQGVEQCWKQKQRTYQPSEMPDAQAAYEHARQIYRKRLQECREANSN